MTDEPVSNEMDVLICKYLDGTANASEIEWLDAEVRCNPETRRALFLAADQDVAIREILTEEQCLKSLRSAESHVRSVPSRGPSSQREKKTGHRSPFWKIAALSGCAVAACVLFAFSHFQQSTSPPSMRMEASDDGVIIRRQNHDIVASKSCDLRPDDMLIVPEGTGATVVYRNKMRLEVGSGSTVYLGPRAGADPILGGDGAMRVFLKSGAFTADLSDPAAQTVFYAPDSESLTHSGGLKLRVTPGQTRLNLRRGNVEFHRGKQAMQVMSPGDSILDTGGAPPVVRPANYVDLQQGLMAHWKFFDGGLHDVSGNDNDCKLFGAEWVQAESGRALLFKKPGDAAFAENSPTLNLTGEVSVAAWIYLDRVDNDQKIAGIQDNIAGGYKLSVFDDNKVDFIIRDRNNKSHTNRKQPGGTQLKSKQWYHVVGIYSETDHVIKIFVNGKPDRSIHDETIMPRTTGSFVIGREPWANGDPARTFCGMIDEMRVYNRVLNDAEVFKLAQRRSNTIVAAAE